MIPAPVHDGRRLDHFPRFDPASLDYPVAAGPGTPLPARGRLWAPGRVLDQGSEGACVGFGVALELSSEPVPVPRIGPAYARGVYLNAKRRDRWPGEAYDGTSVLAGMQEARARGLYGLYRWARTAEQFLAGIANGTDYDQGGPGVVGVEWRAGAYTTDRLGVLRPSGPVVGGHCLCILGVVVPADLDAWADGDDEAQELLASLEELGLLDGVRAVLTGDGEDAAAIGINSWGPVFGVRGLFVLPLSVLRAWVDAGGEFAQPQQRTLPARRGDAMTAEDDTGTQEPADATLHISAVEVLQGDRILDPPDELQQESVTVRGTPRQVRGWRGNRVVVDTTAGTFQLGAADAVTVRRAT